MNKTEIELQASVIRGLISYHERMLLACNNFIVANSESEIQENKKSPEIIFQKDVYLETLKTTLELMKAKMNKCEACFKNKEELESNEHIIKCLISYHKKMRLPIEKENNPEIAQQDDVYLKAIEKGLELIEAEIVRVNGS